MLFLVLFICLKLLGLLPLRSWTPNKPTTTKTNHQLETVLPTLPCSHSTVDHESKKENPNRTRACSTPRSARFRSSCLAQQNKTFVQLLLPTLPRYLSTDAHERTALIRCLLRLSSLGLQQGRDAQAQHPQPQNTQKKKGKKRKELHQPTLIRLLQDPDHRALSRSAVPTSPRSGAAPLPALLQLTRQPAAPPRPHRNPIRSWREHSADQNHNKKKPAANLSFSTNLALPSSQRGLHEPATQT